ncbi:YppF family protein [Ectobacillus funiculus]|uniref:YppF family protein n=1 Tax=Ectobacillus funiculus TaxID=137993 RepID=UPI00397A20FE
MLLQDFIHQFILMNKRVPLHTTELLDYLQKSYTGGDLSANDYKSLFRELNKRGVERAGRFILENILTFNRTAL